MSKSALQILSRQNGGVIPLVDDGFSGPIPGTAIKLQGCWVDSITGGLYISGGPVDHHANGLPFDVNGRLCFAVLGSVVSYHQGLRFLDGLLSAAPTGGGGEYFDQGLKFSSSGSILADLVSPPGLTVTWHYPYTQDANNTKGAGTTTHLHGTEQWCIFDGGIVNYGIDVPALSVWGIDPRPQDTGRHQWHYDVTQGTNPPFPQNPNGWTNADGLQRQVVAVTAPDGTGQVGALLEDGSTGNHDIDMSWTFKNQGANGRNRGGVILKPIDVNASRYVRFTNVPAEQVTFDLVNETIASSGVGGAFDSFVVALDDGWYYCYFDLRNTVGGNPEQPVTLQCLNPAQNVSYPGRIGEGYYVYAAHYASNNNSQYSPVLNVGNTSNTRLGVSDCYADVSTPSDRDYTIYFEATNITGIIPSIDATDNTALFASYTNGTFGDGADQGALFGLLRLTSGELLAGFQIFIPGGDCAQAFSEIPDWQRGETLRCMLQVIDGQLPVFTCDTETTSSAAGIIVYPSGMFQFHHWVDQATIGSLEQLNMAFKNVKRIEATGLTLQEAQDAV